jgi:hypothetical protein
MSERPDTNLRRPQADSDVEYKRASLQVDVPPTTSGKPGRPARFWVALGLAGIEFAYLLITGRGLISAVATGLVVFVVVGFFLEVVEWIRKRIVR